MRGLREQVFVVSDLDINRGTNIFIRECCEVDPSGHLQGRSRMTFHGPARYAHRLLIMTVDTLATAPGDVRSRLWEAYQAFNPLTPEHFPEPLRKDFEWVMKQLTRYESYADNEEVIQKGLVQVSLKHMRNSTGVKIAQRLLKLHYAIDEYVNSA